ncbi:DUF4870 family protein [Caulobacter hibisci]|uniref:DUF4870 domain-containing protein n=1 Tax=Caulobacter hibisci TaxID=2035993 RepID=A0ABS0T1Y3_9CAUL|nr:hypothetical protein [Caulobacter hibisci]
MTDPVQDPAVPPALQDDKTMPIVVYACYIGGWITGGVSAIVGLILAYVSKAAAPEWLQSHYVFQIRTFWLSLLFSVIGGLTLIFGIGALILVAVGIWVTVRSVVGLSWLLKGQPYPTPRNWIL